MKAQNIEFSCPAASTQRGMELPGSIHRSTRPLRGQLQRQVMQVPPRKQPSVPPILWRGNNAPAHQLKVVVVLVL